jgi:hypothetical protein
VERLRESREVVVKTLWIQKEGKESAHERDNSKSLSEGVNNENSKKTEERPKVDKGKKIQKVKERKKFAVSKIVGLNGKAQRWEVSELDNASAERDGQDYGYNIVTISVREEKMEKKEKKKKQRKEATEKKT